MTDPSDWYYDPPDDWFYPDEDGMPAGMHIEGDEDEEDEAPFGDEPFIEFGGADDLGYYPDFVDLGE